MEWLYREWLRICVQDPDGLILIVHLENVLPLSENQGGRRLSSPGPLEKELHAAFLENGYVF